MGVNYCLFYSLQDCSSLNYNAGVYFLRRYSYCTCTCKFQGDIIQSSILTLFLYYFFEAQMQRQGIV